MAPAATVDRSPTVYPEDGPANPEAVQPEAEDMRQVEDQGQTDENKLRVHIYALLEKFRRGLSFFGTKLGAMPPEHVLIPGDCSRINYLVSENVDRMKEALLMSGNDQTSPGWHMATNYLAALKSYVPADEDVEGVGVVKMSQSLMALWKNVQYAGEQASLGYQKAYNYWSTQNSGKNKNMRPYKAIKTTASTTRTLFQATPQ